MMNFSHSVEDKHPGNNTQAANEEKWREEETSSEESWNMNELFISNEPNDGLYTWWLTERREVEQY